MTSSESFVIHDHQLCYNLTNVENHQLLGIEKATFFSPVIHKIHRRAHGHIGDMQIHLEMLRGSQAAL